MSKRIVMVLVVVASLALSAGAADFVALVDVERGLLLIPEGTVVPRGVEFSLDGVDAREAMSVDGVAAEPRRFVYAYAPAEQFAEARQQIEAAEAKWAEALKADDLPEMSGVIVDTTYYYYFPDGAWHGARKFSYHDEEFGNKSYMVTTLSYATAGEFDSRVTVSQSSTQYSYWTTSKTCLFYGVDGDCNTNGYGFIAPASQNFSATVTSRASIIRSLYPPCSFPCKQNLSSSIVITFP